MQAKASQQSNKWLSKGGQPNRTAASNPQTLRSQNTGASRVSEDSPSMRDLLFSVGAGPRLTSRQLRELLNTPDDKSDPVQLRQAVFALLEQAKAVERQTQRDQQEELGTTSFSQTIQSRVDHAKFRRTALMHEQEALRAEILQLNDRISKLETLKASAIPSDHKPKKHTPSINQRKLKPAQIERELLELGVKKQLSLREKVAINDQEVKVQNTELLVRQRAAIEEMSKYELLQLKKPQFVLLMDRLTR
jgi:DNA repair exonuclease SbcCD ATPase subunit